MISQAIQKAIQAVIPNTYFAMGDEEILTPYCVHKEAGTPQLCKEGLLGYSFSCEVVIIDDLPEKVETLARSVISALAALQGTTSKGTKIEAVTFDGDDPDYDAESKLYVTLLRFTIETNNR
jgi:hypothetical protein